MKEMEAIVLAGGFGVRMGDITLNTQKCLLPIEEKPALGHVMDSLINAFGSVDLKVGVGYKSEQVIDYVNRNKPHNMIVTYVPHVPGTEGWGIYKDMRSYIKGDFVAMPGDIVVSSVAYEKVVEKFKGNDVDAAMSLSPKLDEIATHGIGRIERGRVVDLRWPPSSDIKPNTLRDMTIWASDKKFFDVIEQYPNPRKSIGYVFMDAIKNERPIAGNKYELPWVHIGYPQDLNKTLPR